MATSIPFLPFGQEGADDQDNFFEAALLPVASTGILQVSQSLLHYC